MHLPDQHSEVVGVHHELLVVHDQATLQPARRLVHEVGSREDRCTHGVGGLQHRLGVGGLGRRVVATAPERQPQTAGQLSHGVGGQHCLGGPEGGGTAPEVHRGQEAAVDNR